MNLKDYNEILFFWFGEIKGELSTAKNRQMWYSSSTSTDVLISDQFKDTLLSAAQGQFNDWRQSPHGRLALIILFDQISRNIFRGRAEAFAYDHQALELCIEGVKEGADQSLYLIERLFFYHPLEHAESLEAQNQCVQLMQTLVKQYSGLQQDVANNSLKFATEHRDIILQFGRFPHRNEVLKRQCSAAELAYLNSGGKRFGQ
ncbi:MAG: hypothetical protein ACI88A_000629 [Paraglaciecola sp.]|jgi:uncharacterized protein (DUF924 family)